MAEVVLDANVIVALLYADDSLHQRAVEVRKREAQVLASVAIGAQLDSVRSVIEC